MLKQLRSALVVFVLLTLLTGMIYPAAVMLIGQGLFPRQANGSIIEKNGKPVGSELIGQEFTSEKYFWGRPSATAPAYNAASSSGSNLGPTNPDQVKAVQERIDALRKAHPDQANKPVPVDLVTASGSGLDPHISPAAAEYQVARVAKARGLSQESVREFVAANTEGRTFFLLGEPRVNVLELNVALDKAGQNQK
ncbi:MAG TPA: potassium-transporting ATPase subunit KdpC [Gemmataceae bacterium]|jgi:K+-transporting ATPase ATPase C chain|nr:potassium-transporting ATPase subunit KdpC [Gemmataceae bacterium]